jgi:hypothetical protein
MKCKNEKVLALDDIRLDGDTQSRIQLDQNVIKDYAALMATGRKFPPLLVVFDGEFNWLVDGFHRHGAAVEAKLKEFECQVEMGAREEARWLSYAANQDHGLQRTNGDKQKAVTAAMKHPKGAKLSDRKIAEHVGVDHKTVAKYRGQLESSGEIPQIEEREVSRGGVTYEQNTTNIGKSPAATMRSEAMARASQSGTGRVVSGSDDPVGDACDHEWDEEGDCTKCRMPRPPAASAEQAAVAPEQDRLADGPENDESIKELTFEERVSQVNGEIESFCRGLEKWFEDNCPDLATLNHKGRNGSAGAKIREACKTLRNGKLHKSPCPKCQGGGCKTCQRESDFGAVSVVTFNQIAG